MLYFDPCYGTYVETNTFDQTNMQSLACRNLRVMKYSNHVVNWWGNKRQDCRGTGDGDTLIKTA